jgi:hypothetical protein
MAEAAFESWLDTLTLAERRSILGTAFADSHSSKAKSLFRAWRAAGSPDGRKMVKPAALPAQTPLMKTPKRSSAPVQRDAFACLRRYESLIETNPVEAGRYYMSNAQKILAELELLHSQEALAKSIRHVTHASSSDEARDLRLFKEYAALVNSGNALEAGKFYQAHATEILRGRGAAEDKDAPDEPDEKKAPPPEGVCSVCYGDTFCPECTGHGADLLRCTCSACGGTGEAKQ